MQTVTITLSEYRELLEAKANLNFLHSLAVDHWDGYEVLPDIDDFDTIEEWHTACEEASNRPHTPQVSQQKPSWGWGKWTV